MSVTGLSLGIRLGVRGVFAASNKNVAALADHDPVTRRALSADLELRLHDSQHLLDRGPRGGELIGIARPDHDIGVWPDLVVEKRVAAEGRVRMFFRKLAELGADIALAGVGTDRFRQHLLSGLQLRPNL